MHSLEAFATAERGCNAKRGRGVVAAWLRLTGARERERNTVREVWEDIGDRRLGICSRYSRFHIANRTCRSLMYQVRLAAGLLRPDVQFKRSISSIRYFLLNPCIDGPWEGNSAEQETSGTHGSRKYAKHVRNTALTFDRFLRVCTYTRARTYIRIYIYNKYMHIDRTSGGLVAGAVAKRGLFKIPGCTNQPTNQPVYSRVHRSSR